MMMKQKTAINQLEGEMNEIETEMKLASSCKNRKQDNENSEDLQSFMKGQDEYATKIAKEAEEIQCKFLFKKKKIDIKLCLRVNFSLGSTNIRN